MPHQHSGNRGRQRHERRSRKDLPAEQSELGVNEDASGSSEGSFRLLHAAQADFRLRRLSQSPRHARPARWRADTAPRWSPLHRSMS
jgi:hypothetical protein